MLKKDRLTEYYTYPQRFFYYRYAVNDEAPYFSSSNSEMKNVVLVRANNEQTLNKTFIEKVLSAVEIESSSEYAIHFSKQPPAWPEVKKNYPHLQFLLAFGFRPREIGLQTHDHYNQWIYLDNCHLICSQSIEELEPDAQLKMQLWNQLKKLDRK